MKQTLNPVQQGIVNFLQSNETWLRPILTESVFNDIDWVKAAEAVKTPDLVYPDYYMQDFHSVTGGYLNKDAVLTYDPITKQILVPSEAWLRQSLADSFPAGITSVLDLGCGTGTATRAIAERFRNADVVGVDLSPYMVAAAARKATHLPNARFLHANAESVPFDDNSFDAVTASLLFHEMPPHAGLSVLREAFRVLKPNGVIRIFDGSQSGVAKVGGHISKSLFMEPYADKFLASNLCEMMQQAGFKAVAAEAVLVLYEIRKGVK
jgi:ubiquinone/menaquinone biosynthesis C-methylase UbiE